MLVVPEVERLANTESDDEPLDNTVPDLLGGPEAVAVRLLETDTVCVVVPDSVVENDAREELEGVRTPVVDSLTDADINPELLNEADTVFDPDTLIVLDPVPDTVDETVSVQDPEIEPLGESDRDDTPVRLEDTLLLPDFVGFADPDTDAEVETLEEVLEEAEVEELGADDSDACDTVAELERAPEPE